MNTVTLHMYVSMSYPGVNHAEYGIHIRVVAPQEYVNLYSTRRCVGLKRRKHRDEQALVSLSNKRGVVARRDADAMSA